MPFPQLRTAISVTRLVRLVGRSVPKVLALTLIALALCMWMPMLKKHDSADEYLDHESSDADGASRVSRSRHRRKDAAILEVQEDVIDALICGSLVHTLEMVTGNQRI